MTSRCALREAALAASVWFGAAGCGASDAPVVLLVSWDTTRADALGCYADVAHWGRDLPAHLRPVPSTPHADALATRGVRHQWALAHAPTTLASHASLMSGRDTRGASVPRNGFPIEPDLPLLAPRFRAAGWDTIGVVGASVLAADMGLSRGFSIYDDHVTEKVRRRYEHTADRVVDRALAAIDERSWRDRSTPLFLFVHFFDAHSPWDSAPEAIRSRLVDPTYAGAVDGGSGSVDWLVKTTRAGGVGAADRRQARALYLAEVAAMDAALGRLTDGLAERFTLQDSLVVLVGDHGEALDQPAQRPYGHGMDVDLVATHVPLLVAGTGRFSVPAGRTVSTPVGLMDVAPTIAALAELAPDPTAQGTDLQAAWSSDSAGLPARVLLAEATKPTEVESPDAWNNLRKERSAVGHGWVLTETPWQSAKLGGPGPHLFALAPGQPAATHLPADDLQVLRAALHAWDRSAPAYRDPSMTEDTRDALRALGYLD